MAMIIERAMINGEMGGTGTIRVFMAKTTRVMRLNMEPKVKGNIIFCRFSACFLFVSSAILSKSE